MFIGRYFWTGVRISSAPPDDAQANYFYYFRGGFAVYRFKTKEIKWVYFYTFFILN